MCEKARFRKLGRATSCGSHPGVKHWHDATAANGMSHIAFSEELDGKTVEWME